MNNTIIAVDNSGSYRVYLTLSTDMVQEAVDIHGCSHTAAAALGRTITAAGLMGLMLKGENDKLTVQIKGDGPAREILASANSRGEVKGYISDPGVELPLTESGKLNVSGAIGNGTLTVIKDLGLKEPYVGRIDLVSGEIAEDFTQYFMASEQQPSSVALGVRMNSGKVEGAAGMIIQVLPDASDEALTALEDMLFYMDSISLLAQDAEQSGAEDKIADLFGRIFKGLPEAFAPHILEERELRWHCDCSRERMERALISIGKKDLAEIAEEGHAELTCSFCRTSYTFDKEELMRLLEEAR
ncbi:MAG: Hsp33 family molecular chaperone HslO [Firmicutes bacterium]|nr:Hsp33 family molecular chaperone HslO [Bacillota bacterium]